MIKLCKHTTKNKPELRELFRKHTSLISSNKNDTTLVEFSEQNHLFK